MFRVQTIFSSDTDATAGGASAGAAAAAATGGAAAASAAFAVVVVNTTLQTVAETRAGAEATTAAASVSEEKNVWALNIYIDIFCNFNFAHWLGTKLCVQLRSNCRMSICAPRIHESIHKLIFSWSA